MTSPTDEDLLDALLGRFLTEIAEGRAIAVESVLPQRPDLTERVRDVLALAQRIAVQKPAGFPTIPGYRILGELGSGGMGMVYLALQESMQRQVALKTMSSARLSGTRARARFEREVLAIARVQHPNIVPIYETGEAAGVPFYTMEYVQGRSLRAVLAELKHCGKAPSALRGPDLARAAGCPDHEVPQGWRATYVEAVSRLVAEIAAALAHAHAHGVIHRDMKPSNVLVRPDGRAMLVDFGLARVDDEDGLTLSGDFVGTPHYSSPEQLDPSRGTLDARTDVYSLGVTLYELLTLDVPFRGSSAPGLLRALRAQQARSPKRLNPQIPRDLETICMTAIERDAARRYATAAAFADDLRRLLEYRPIAARPAGAGTRLLRWAQRNPARATALGLAAILVLGVPTALWLQESRAYRRIRAQIARVEAIADFQRGMLGSVDPAKQGRDIKVIDVLAQARTQLETKFADAPDIRATLLETIGESYFGLGMFEDAEAVFADAVVAHATSDAVGADMLMARLWVAATKMERGQVESAEAILQDVIRIARSAHGPRHPTTLTGIYNLGKSLASRGEIAAALPLAQEVVAGRIASLEPDHDHTLAAQGLLAWIHSEIGNVATAEATYRDLVERYARRFTLDHVETMKARNNHAGTLLQMGQAERAAAMMREILASRRQQLTDDHPLTIHTAASLGECLRRAGKLDEARSLLERALADARRVLLPDHWILLDILYKQGRCLLALKEFAAAEQSACELEEVRTRVLTANHRQTIAAAYLRASIVEASKGAVGGEARYREVLERARAHLDDRDPIRWTVQSGLGQCLSSLQSFGEAERLLLESLDRLTTMRSNEHVDVTYARDCLAALYEARHEPARAAAYRHQASPAGRAGAKN